MKIEVGRNYKDGHGNVVYISECVGEGLTGYCFNGEYQSGNKWYSEAGSCNDGNKESALVKEVLPETKKKPQNNPEAIMPLPHATVTAKGYEQTPIWDKPVEAVNHPLHYGGKDNLYETIKVMKARLTREEYVGALKFNVYKYNDRAGKKGSAVEDHEKGLFYQTELVNFLRENPDL